MAVARRIRSSSPSGSTTCRRSALARSNTRYWNINGVTTLDSATSIAASKRLGVHRLVEGPQRGLQFDVGSAAEPAPDRGELRRRLEGAAGRHQDRQVLQHTVHQLLHRVRRRVYHRSARSRPDSGTSPTGGPGSAPAAHPTGRRARSPCSPRAAGSARSAATSPPPRSPSTPSCSSSGFPRTNSAPAGLLQVRDGRRDQQRDLRDAPDRQPGPGQQRPNLLQVDRVRPGWRSPRPGAHATRPVRRGPARRRRRSSPDPGPGRAPPAPPASRCSPRSARSSPIRCRW